MNETLDKMIELLLEEKKNYEHPEIIMIFDRLIENLKKLKVKLEDRLLEQIDKDLNDLDCKCDDLCEVVNLFSYIHSDLKSIIKREYVKKLREENRKRRISKNG